MKLPMTSVVRRTPFRLLTPVALFGLTVVIVAGCGHEPAISARDLAAPRAVKVGGAAISSKPSPAAVKPPVPVSAAPKGRSSIRFREVERSAGIAFTHVSGNSPDKHYPTANGSGVAMFDYDGDGRLDLYFATTRNFPLDAPTTSLGNKLYQNRGDGTFDDVTDRAGVGFRGFCHGVAVGDVDNNGYPDLYLTNYGPNVLYLNNGDGTFRIARDFGAECRSWSTAAAFLDYDGDGWLDLYVSCYGHWAFDEPHTFCGNEAEGVRIYCSPITIPPAPHFLFRNRGNGTFEDVTERAGVLRRDGRGMGVVAADVNRDGRVDLYVANDMCPHFLFLNRGDGTFEDVTDTSGAALTESGHVQGGMGVDVEDLDEDGYPELFVTNFDGEYNTIHRTTDGRNFEDVSARSGIVRDSMPDVGWGCALADLDNDGWPDMITVNGHIYDNLADVGRDGEYAQLPKIWRNRGRGRFKLVADPGPFFDVGHVARGAAFGDLDNDGDIDVVINRMDSRPAVVLNESQFAHWIRLELIGTRSNRSAIGAAVVVHAGNRVLHRQVKGGGSYASANDPRLLVGLGGAERVNRVEIRWPSGRSTTLTDPALGRTHRIIEPDGLVGSNGPSATNGGRPQ
jgi:enediyne biosynthesis protein E4